MCECIIQTITYPADGAWTQVQNGYSECPTSQSGVEIRFIQSLIESEP